MTVTAVAGAAPTLPPAPLAVADPTGQLRMGVYAGSVETVDWNGLAAMRARGRLYRLSHHKRWWYAAAATRELFVACAMVDVGYVANGFVYAVDLVERTRLLDRSLLGLPVQVSIGPRPAAGARAHFRTPGVELKFERASAAAPYRLRLRVGDTVRGEIELAAEGTIPFTLICPLPAGGIANCTQKLAALPASGEVQVAGRSFSLDGGLGGLDYTNGLLARETAWRWAFGFGRTEGGGAIGWNLVEGFNDAPGTEGEHVVWLDGVPHPVPAVRFGFDQHDPMLPWHLRSDDGAVDLTFAPIAGHFENHNLVVARSFFVQPAGLFAGTLRLGGRTITVADVPGVTEDQRVRW
ncbi:MAG TPA: DUF2804 domain-containing protein [Polyangia bacterium]|nr:DUF2804 domain-containing protein [Polyangia bacterium]